MNLELLRICHSRTRDWTEVNVLSGKIEFNPIFKNKWKETINKNRWKEMRLREDKGLH